MTAPRHIQPGSLTLWSDRRRFLLRSAASIAFPMSLVDCGGGDDDTVATPETDSVPTIPLTKTPAKGTIVMPAGASVQIASVTNPFASNAPAANGTFDFVSIAESTILAVGTGPAGGAVLYGLLQDGTAELSPRSTAVVLAYTFLGVGVYVGDMQVAYLDAIAKSPSLDALSAAVSAAIVARGESWLQTTDTALVAALSGMQQALSVTALTTAAQAGRAHALGILQNKTDRVSGLQVVNDGVGAFKITNYYRRRSYAYVDRVSYKTSYTAAPTPSPAPIGGQPTKVNATKAITNSLATIAQYFAGATDFYTPVVSDSIPIPLTPDSAALTSYTMVSVGLGGSAGDYSLLTDTQRDGMLRVIAETIVLDFMVPIFSSIFLPARDLKSGGAFAPETLAAAAPGVLKDVIDSLATSYDIVRDKIQLPLAAGQRLTAADIADVIWDVIVLAAGRDSFKNAILALFQAFFNAIGDRSSARAVINEGAKKILDFTAALDLGLQIMDTAVSGLQIALCDVADQFTLDVTKANVKLNPLNPNIDYPNPVTFNVSVIDSDLAPGTDLSYTWTSTCAFGDISDTMGHDSASGTTTFDSTSPTLTYKPNAKQGSGGDQDIVTCTVYLGQINQRTAPLGKASCTITYSTLFTPSSTVLNFDAQQTFSATVSTSLLQSGRALRYVWTVTGGNGSLGGASTQTTSVPEVTYTAGHVSAGTDTLTLQVTDLIGVVLASGSATAKVISDIRIGIGPPNPTLAKGATKVFFVAAAGGALPAGANYRWQLTGGGSIGASSTQNTTSPSITYTASTTGNGPDTLSVTLLDGDNNPLATASTTISIQSDWVGVYRGTLLGPGCLVSSDKLQVQIDLGGEPGLLRISVTSLYEDGSPSVGTDYYAHFTPGSGSITGKDPQNYYTIDATLQGGVIAFTDSAVACHGAVVTRVNF